LVMSKPVYSWSEHFAARGLHPAAAAAELDRIEKRFGAVTPETVVMAAEPEDSLLHGLFEWDDDDAARQWRLSQARRLVSSLRVVYVESQPQVPARLSVRFVRSKKTDPQRVYLKSSAVLAIDEERLAFFRDELLAIEGRLSRTEAFSEFEPIRQALAVVRANLA
jgi:hypothetical protein